VALIKSISGIRGTIGGKPGDTLSPLDIVKFSAAFGKIIQQTSPGRKLKIVIGRDGRISGEMVRDLVVNTLIIEPKSSLLGLLLVFSGVPFYYYFKKGMTDSES